MTARCLLPGLLVALVVSGCDSAPEDGSTPAPEVEGTCHAKIDGATVDIVDVEDVGASASLDGSTLHLGCGVNEETATGSTYTTRLSFTIKAFDGVGDYTVDDTGTYGKGGYNGNDGNGYDTFKPSTGGRDSSCTISVTEADDSHVAGTFTCTDLHAFVNDATGACCDSQWVDVTEGTFDLPFSSDEEL